MSSFQDTFSITLRIITEVAILLGIVGNIITYIVFSRPTFRKSSVSLYCRALAISDSFIVYLAVVYFYMIFYNYGINTYSDAMCKLFTYIKYSLSSIPGWILIAFSIEKVLSLKKVATNRMKKPIVHYMVILGIVLFNLLLYIEIPIYMKLFPNTNHNITTFLCNSDYLEFGSALNTIYIIESSFLPFLIMFVSSLITVKLLRDSRQSVISISSMKKKRTTRDKKFAITSITFNVLFIVLRMPHLIATGIGIVHVDLSIRQIAAFLFSINYVVCLYVHLAFNSIFRREFLILFRIRQQSVGSS